MTPKALTASQRRAIEQDAAQVVNRFYHYLDGGNYAELAELMAPQGIWYRQGKELKGPAMVLEALSVRPEGMTTQHTNTNMVVDVIDATHADVKHYLTVFAHTAAKIGDPAKVELPLHLGIREEKLVKTKAGWRIANITGRNRFTR